MSRRLGIALALLAVAVLVGAFLLPDLWHRVRNLSRKGPTEEQARREITQLPIATPSDVKVKARLFWASTTSPGTLEAVELELRLSADPVQRSKQLIHALIAEPPEDERRTLPEDVTLLEFYLLPDGSAVADFSDTLSTETPSGILSEQTAVDSLARTLGANVDAIRRLKILIHGQDTDTLAGHLDLTGFFAVRPEGAPALAVPAAAPAAKPTKPTGGLTPPSLPGKLGH
ncbi:MAG TPA: GerMN domain-containing protein [Candidatus Acidoferrales bacterium]|nr:GerMN domain-containing protein [Candidatus Acidoferrales bacterium]